MRKHYAKGLCNYCYHYLYYNEKLNKSNWYSYFKNWVMKKHGSHKEYRKYLGDKNFQEICNILYSKEVADAIFYDGALLDDEMKKRGMLK